MYEKLIQVVDCLTDDELNQVRDLLPTLKFQEPKEEGKKTFSRVESKRSCHNFFVPPKSRMARMMDLALNKSLKKYRKEIAKLGKIYEQYPVPGSPATVSHRDHIEILRYNQGDDFRYHHDTGPHPGLREYYRTLSCLLYLNDDFEGGGTDFVHQTFYPKAGQVIIFPSNWCFPHQGQEVVHGTKYVASTFYYTNMEKK